MIILAVRIEDDGHGRVNIRWKGVTDKSVKASEADACAGVCDILERGIKARTGRPNEAGWSCE